MGLKVVRVASYSPHSVAEHAVGLILALNRKIHRAYNRTRDFNFAARWNDRFRSARQDRCRRRHRQNRPRLHPHHAGFRLQKGHRLRQVSLAWNLKPWAARYAKPGEIGEKADIISLHCPLTPDTYHIINASTLARAKRGALLVNTSRGALLDAEAAIESLQSGQLGGLAIDVYEQEAGLFYRDLSGTIISDDVLQRLMSFPNVIITGHQAFLTSEAISTIAQTTINSISEFAAGQPLSNEILAT